MKLSLSLPLCGCARDYIVVILQVKWGVKKYTQIKQIDCVEMDWIVFTLQNMLYKMVQQGIYGVPLCCIASETLTQQDSGTISPKLYCIIEVK